MDCSRSMLWRLIRRMIESKLGLIRAGNELATPGAISIEPLSQLATPSNVLFRSTRDDGAGLRGVSHD